MITTRMPDKSEGFALLVSIGATFLPPIQLSMGFVLTGVGGLISVNRAVKVDALRAGLKSGTLGGLLFPEPNTVAANASTMISELESIFPAEEGRFLVGPMVKIGWGNPILATADVGVFLEFPDPGRIFVLGQVKTALPSKDKDLVVINLDILGVVDFAKAELTFQASLFDSRILEFTLSGDSAFLLGWGRDPRFALSLGGFHPRFSPPPDRVFANLQRLSLTISAGGDFELTCSAYLALTPNTLQFGARVSLHASACGLSVEGYLGFDALFTISPFSFEVEVCGGVHIEFKGISLLGIDLALLLSGPTPWNARGTASISLLFFSIDVDFSFTWGSREQATLPAVDPWVAMPDGPSLLDVLAMLRSWGSVLPDEQTMVEVLRSIEDEKADKKVVMHPAGRLEVRQHVVPLDITLQKVGNAPIKDHDRFNITGLTVGSQDNLTLSPIEEFFARGQYQELTGDQRLSIPSFEEMPAGVTMAASQRLQIDDGFGKDASWIQDKVVTYETILIRADGSREEQKTTGSIAWSTAGPLVEANASRRTAVRMGPQARFASDRVQPKVGVSKEGYCIVAADTLVRVGADKLILPNVKNENLTRMAADHLLEQIERSPGQAGKFMVVPHWEAAA